MAEREFYSGKLLYPAIGVLGLLAVLFGVFILPRLGPEHPLVDTPAPDFALPVYANGEPEARVRLSEIEGRVVLLDFWSTSCEPCVKEAPILDRLARKYGDDVTLLGVSVDDEREDVEAFARTLGLSYPLLGDELGEAMRSYRVDRVPTLVVVDKRGRIAAYHQGLLSEAAIEALITSHR